MISRSILGRQAQLAGYTRCCASPSQCRSFASAANGTTSFSYETGTVNGVKIASRDIAGPTTTIAVIAKAGTRYEPSPGLTLGLEQFAFKNTHRRSALRITRESELLGGQLDAYHTREALIVSAKCLRPDLPYFAELLGEVISQTKYTAHEFNEIVRESIQTSQRKLLASVSEMAINSAHGIAFHKGLGNPLYPVSSTPLHKYVDDVSVSKFSKEAYAEPNIAVVANGASLSLLSKWVGETFQDVVKGGAALSGEKTKYYGGEERIAHGSGNALVLAFPGSSSFTAGSSYRPEISVLATLLGGASTIKWSPGFSIMANAVAKYPGAHATTTHYTYSDTGLLAIRLHGSAKDVREAAMEAVKAIKSIAGGTIDKEQLHKAVALARFKALEEGQDLNAGLVATGSGLVHGGTPFHFDQVAKAIEAVNVDKLKAAAKALLDGKATVSAVGDLHVLPYAEDMGLKV